MLQWMTKSSVLRLDEYPISSLESVYEKIYADHNSAEQVEYTLSASAKELYRKFIR